MHTVQVVTYQVLILKNASGVFKASPVRPRATFSRRPVSDRETPTVQAYVIRVADAWNYGCVELWLRESRIAEAVITEHTSQVSNANIRVPSG